MEKLLKQLVEKLESAAGSNLRSVILYGSAVTGEFHRSHSDLNILCLVHQLEAGTLKSLAPAAAWWTRQRHPAPLTFTWEELQRAADIFAIELVDIQSSHRVLWGDDPFPALRVPMDLHRWQVERELRHNLVRLRQQYLAGPRGRKALLALMAASVSSFAALFRHALFVLGEAPPPLKRDAVRRLADLVGFDASPFETLLDFREGKRKSGQIDADALFPAYLASVTKLVEETDQRWSR
jgi:hypothetical protein